MVVGALNSTRVSSLAIAALAAFLVALLVPGVVEAQTAAAKPPVAAKPAQPPAKPAAPPAAKPAAATAATPATLPDAAKPAAAETPAAAVPAAAPVAGTLTIASIAGTWDGVAQTPNGDLPVHMVLTHADGKLTGSMETQMGILTVTGSALTGDVLELGFDLQGAAGGLSGKVEGDKYSGTWTVGADSGPFALTRVPAADIKK